MFRIIGVLVSVVILCGVLALYADVTDGNHPRTTVMTAGSSAVDQVHQNNLQKCQEASRNRNRVFTKVAPASASPQGHVVSTVSPGQSASGDKLDEALRTIKALECRIARLETRVNLLETELKKSSSR